MMAAVSVWLVALLVFKLQAACGFCFASAAVSWTNCALVQRAAGADGKVPAATASIAATFAALLAFYFVETGIALDQARSMAAAYMAGDRPAVVAPSRPPAVVFEPPAVDTVSTDRAIRLARHLQTKHAKIYGAYWCSHCFAQKQAFGAEAATLLDYVECADDGRNSLRATCQARNIAGYPTWEIDGKLYPGERSLAELEVLSGLAP